MSPRTCFAAVAALWIAAAQGASAANPFTEHLHAYLGHEDDLQLDTDLPGANALRDHGTGDWTPSFSTDHPTITLDSGNVEDDLGFEYALRLGIRSYFGEAADAGDGLLVQASEPVHYDFEGGLQRALADWGDGTGDVPPPARILTDY